MKLSFLFVLSAVCLLLIVVPDPDHNNLVKAMMEESSPGGDGDEPPVSNASNKKGKAGGRKNPKKNNRKRSLMNGLSWFAGKMKSEDEEHPQHTFGQEKSRISIVSVMLILMSSLSKMVSRTSEKFWTTSSS